MNINEQEGILDNLDYQWMRDTIKQQQEEIAKLKLDNEDWEQSHDKVARAYEESQKDGLETLELVHSQDKRIAELEKERREITAAHEAFLREFNYEYGWEKRNNEGNPRSQWHKGALEGFNHVKRIYDKHLQEPIHLAEQVRMAKLSAGVDGE